MTVPTALLSLLHRADGSAQFSQGGYTVVGAVNGPVEVQRRDELPEEAAIEVNVRPAVGVASPRERHLESIIHAAVRHVILTRNHPRTLIQITLQVISVPEDESLLRSSQCLSVLPSLLQASILALLSASIPMSKTFNATSVAVLPGKLAVNPSPKEIAQASSVHVLAFSSYGELMATESEGAFSIDEWDHVYEEAKQICYKENEADGDQKMDQDSAPQNLQGMVEKVIAEKVEKERKWKDSS